MPASGAGLRAGIGCFGRALRLLRGHSELWVACALPLLVNLGVFGIATLVFLSQLDAVAAALRDALATAEPRVWYEWIWIGPLRALANALRWLLIGLFALAVYFLFTLVGGVLASPLLDRLSERVEGLQAQGLRPAPRGSLASSLRALREEARRAGFFLVLQAALWVLAWIPGLAPLAWLAALLLCVFFLPLDYTGYVLDRRELPFRLRRAWLWRQRRAIL